MDGGPVTVRGKRALPHAAVLVDGAGAEVTPAPIAAAPLIRVTYSDGVVAAEDVTTNTLAAGEGTSGTAFEYTAERLWQFNLKTGNYTKTGTYTVTMASGDPEAYAIDPTCEATFVKQ